MNLTKRMKIIECGAPIAAASDTDSNTDIIDMANWEGICFICPVTDSVATGVATLKLEQNSDNSDTGMAALTGASAAATCAVNDDLNNELLIVDIYKPRERYIQAVRTSATANIAFGNVIAVLYNGRTMPVTADDSVLISTTVVSPAEAS